ncbi:MAG TPA: 1-deoxy-D-xylulose-5-phosphate synthase [Planctomycetota bacterium]|nr:1-deoxy-D-xylulose-5-phosphate synthase [Planctomycetota bacterium]
MSDHVTLSGTHSADSTLKTLEEVAHKAGAAVGAERPLIECPIARPFLKHIKDASDVKRIPAELLPELAAEIREKINATVQNTGGHLSSNLGVTELTIALHRVYDFKVDRLVLDVGHQVYPHKLLTGRFDRFHTLRQQGGISGYPNHHESPEYDMFMTAHAGCAVSSGLGLAVGDHMQNKGNHVVAVVGDGALTAGLVFEALNHAGDLKEDMLVILNDNGCSIAPTTGALSATCSDIKASHLFKQVNKKGKEFLEKIPYVGKEVERIAEQAFEAVSRAANAPGSIFLDLGFRYYGPVDGHDIDSLVRWLTEMKSVKGPKLLHVVTKKGHGLPWAAKDPYTWHGAKPYEVEGSEARVKKGAPTPPAYTKVISDAITNVAKKDEKLVAITAAMPDGTGLINFQKVFPKRYFDVGICEQHAVCFAAALAKSGLHPVACIYSSFLQRAVDQLMHEISLQDGLPVVLCIDRAGVVGDDGPTHGGVFDIAYMRSFPFFTLMAPKDQPEAEAMVEWAVKSNKAVAIRYPRDNVPAQPLSKELKPIEFGKGEILRQGEKVAILAYGAMVVHAMEAATMLEKKGINATVANARFAKPFDTELLKDLVTKHDRIITVEDHQLQNGFGSAALEEANILGLDTRKIVRLGIPDRWVQHGPRKWQLADAGIDADHIVKAALK